MKLRILVACLGAALLAGCSTPKVEAPVVAQVAAPRKVELPYRWHNGFSEKAREAMVQDFGPTNLAPGEFVWAETIPDSGETRLVVDLLLQTAFVFRDEKLIGVSTISSGKKGKETPLGFWSVQRKLKNYRSRKYSNAPMPYAQMIDDHGIALHGGKLPGYPASNGCVRLPLQFAEKLFTLTKVGSKVVIEG